MMQRSIYTVGETIKFLQVGAKVKGFFRIGRQVSVFECDMSVAYAYFKVLIDREYSKTASLLSRSRHDHLIRGSPSWERDDMKKSGSEKKEAAPVPPLRSGANASASASGNSAHANADAEAEDQECQHHHRLHIPDLKKLNLRSNCKEYCAVVSYVILGILSILISIGVIIVTGLAAAATKIYDTDQSSRLVAMIVLAATAAIGLSMTIYAITGTFRKDTKPLHAAGIVLIILAIIQALIAGVAINVTEYDELSIGKSLSESFRLAKEDNPRHVKLWSATQYDLQCCGVYSPEDYRDLSMPHYFPPNVPISCCPSYDINKAPYTQERQRELCKVNHIYFENGCKGLVIAVFKDTASVVIGIIVVLIVFELLLTILGTYLNKKHKQHEIERDEEAKPGAVPHSLTHK